MLQRTVVVFVTVALLVGAGWVGQAICEEPAAPAAPVAPEATAVPAAPEAPAATAAPGVSGGRDPAQMQQRMEQFRQQMSDRAKKAFGATDEEWKILQPKIEKVQALARQSRGGGMGMQFSGGGGRGGPGGNNQGSNRGGPPSDRPQSDVEKAGQALQKVLDNKDAPAEEIKTALAGVREARAAAKKELEVAQEDLRKVLTVRQEAQCVSMGILE